MLRKSILLEDFLKLQIHLCLTPTVSNSILEIRNTMLGASEMLVKLYNARIIWIVSYVRKDNPVPIYVITNDSSQEKVHRHSFGSKG